MENGLNLEDNKSVNMGATSNQITERLNILRDKKKTLEETLEKRLKELREICLQEADLTGSVPREMPLEPGETLPLVRRRVGTAYQLPENLIKNADSDEQTIEGLELQIQVHRQLAEAAYGLANESKSSKTIKRQNFAEYQKHKNQCKVLTEKLNSLKEKLVEQQTKQKKKSRVPEQVADDAISINTVSEPFVKTDLRQSVRSHKQSVSSEDSRYISGVSRNSYRNSDGSYLDAQLLRHDDGLTSGFYGLSLNGYKNYMERRESLNYFNNQNAVPYNLPLSPSYAEQPQLLMHPQNPHLHSSHSFQHHRSSQQMYNYNPHLEYNRYSSYIPQTQHPQLFRQSSPSASTMKNNYYSPPYPQTRHYQTIEPQYRNPHQIQPHQQYEQNAMTSGLGGSWKTTENGEMVWCDSRSHEGGWDRDKRFGSLDRRKNKRVHKRMSPTVDNKSATLSNMPTYTDHVRIASVKSSHMINRRPDNRQLIRTQSLGSVGAQTIVDSICPSDDSSCNSDNHSINEINHSLRKPKEKEWLETSLDGPVSPTHSVTSHSHSQPALSPHCAMPSLPSPHPSIPSAPPPIPPPTHPLHHQLRHPTPPPPPPHNIPPSPTTQMPSPSIISPDEKYIPHHIPSPIIPKPPLEIPAESNKSPRLPDNNLELFNNNVPENCTVVQAGYEETKPFEMSDFYKYSTKFKKSPVKPEPEPPKPREQDSHVQKSLLGSFDEHKNNYQPELPLKPMHFRNSICNMSMGSPSTPPDNRYFNEMNNWHKDHDHKLDNNNTAASSSKNRSSTTIGSPDNSSNSLNYSQLQVADSFSAEMNAWYNEHEHQIDNNNSNGSAKNRSTATLV